MSLKHIEILIPLQRGMSLIGDLSVPVGATALIIFAHGSGSSRFSPRNQQVATVLQHEKMATLLIDLLTAEEDRIYENRFNIDLLTDRLVLATQRVSQQNEMLGLPVGYFGASTGAASALKAAALLPTMIGAVVSRGGRPDLAVGALGKVKAPTLLIVGGLDVDVLVLNRKALAVLPCEKRLDIIPGASHLFEEQGKLEEVSQLAASWFGKYLKHELR